MLRSMMPIFVASFFMLLLPSQAASADLSTAFLHAAAFDNAPAYTPMSKPDFMGADSFAKMHCAADTDGPLFNNFWHVRRYDSKHHIVLAFYANDACGAAIFVVPKTPVIGRNYGNLSPDVPNIDLSHYSTGRGLHIGSTYEDVLSTYGGKRAKHQGRFVLGYSATAHARSEKIGHALVNLPERITIVIDGDRVSSISFYVDDRDLI